MSQASQESAYASAGALVLTGAIILGVHLINASWIDFKRALPEDYDLKIIKPLAISTHAVSSYTASMLGNTMASIDATSIDASRSLRQGKSKKDNAKTKTNAHANENANAYEIEHPKANTKEAIILALRTLEEAQWLPEIEQLIAMNLDENYADLISAEQENFKGSRRTEANESIEGNEAFEEYDDYEEYESQINEALQKHKPKANKGNKSQQDAKSRQKDQAKYPKGDVNIAANYLNLLANARVLNGSSTAQKILEIAIDEASERVVPYFVCAYGEGNVQDEGEPQGEVELQGEVYAEDKYRARNEEEVRGSHNLGLTGNKANGVSPRNTRDVTFKNQGSAFSSVRFKPIEGCSFNLIVSSSSIPFKARLMLWEELLSYRLLEVKKLGLPSFIFLILIIIDATLTAKIKRRMVKTPNALRFKLGFLALLGSPLIPAWIFLGVSVPQHYFLIAFGGSLLLVAVSLHLFVRSLPMFRPSL